MASGSSRETQGDADSLAEEVADAVITTRAETLSRIEAITLEFLVAVASAEDPTLQLVRQVLTIVSGTGLTVNYPVDMQIREECDKGR